MGREPVPATWPGLTDDEVRSVLDLYRQHLGAGVARARATWHSPRPMSAAALVTAGTTTVLVKRHHAAVRSASRLEVEHAFGRHLLRRGHPVPAVLTAAGGATVVRRGAFVYEVQRAASGLDLYRDVPSWHPYASLGHARAAGRALAGFHRAAVGFPLPALAPAPLTNSMVLVSAADPLAELEHLLAARPGLARALGGRPVGDDVDRHHRPTITSVSAALRALPGQWSHGDWHPSNLVWNSLSATAGVAGVIDLGLSNCTTAVHDLAVAIERSTIDWLDLGRTGGIDADLDAVDAQLVGYEDVRPLLPVESAVLPDVLAVAHVEYALSEIEYFGDVACSAAGVDAAYDGYLLGHSRWFESERGTVLLDHLRRRAHVARGVL